MSTAFPAILPAEVEIHPGEHPEGHFLGMTWNLDTIWVTVVAGLIVIALGFWVRGQLTKKTDDHVPTKLQIVWELIVKEVQTQVEENLGRVHPFVVPLAVALFFFILIANWIEVIPSEPNQHIHALPSPTADTNLTYAMGIIAMVSVWIYGIRKQGARAYFKHYMEPYPILFPLELLQDLLKPITLALRLFGNIFAGGIMIALIGSLVAIAPLNIPLGGLFAVILTVVWKLFDTVFLGGLQAFIFALLTILYFGMAGAEHGEHEDHDDQDDQDDHADTGDRPAAREPTPEPAA
ncbi:MAG TPA: F0F1 ATP synthase subunit A [Nocardioides sp.]|uniref:F0F1 ATP synthase subunit A n=1 Tax=Nocardioides sp. TaxID=35761 RepID=UPI002F403E15